MLNYIWAGLIILSLVFAMVADVGDIAADRYRNGSALPVTLEFEGGYTPSQRRNDISVLIPGNQLASFYGTEGATDLRLTGQLVTNLEGQQVRFAKDVSVPEPLSTIRSVTGARNNELQAVVSLDSAAAGAQSVPATITFPTVRFVKMTAIAAAALDFAETAITIALSLIGALALWMGLLKIAEQSGMLAALVRVTQPIIGKLFPEIPKGHPALGMIVLNLSANMLGLGNAATPLGIKAMEELQTLNQTEDTATNSMVMLLALNTASVQIVPPVLLVAIMGLQINQLFFSIVIVTLLSAVIAVTTTRLFERMRRYRKTDPANLTSATDPTNPEDSE